MHRKDAALKAETSPNFACPEELALKAILVCS
jgi:hypothetical protein